jgi:hypothetical protein
MRDESLNFLSALHPVRWVKTVASAKVRFDRLRIFTGTDVMLRKVDRLSLLGERLVVFTST